jgi:hypothetical protein
MLQRAATLDDPDLQPTHAARGSRVLSCPGDVRTFAMLCHQASLWWSATPYITWLASAFENERHVWSESRYRALVRYRHACEAICFARTCWVATPRSVAALEARFSEVATASAEITSRSYS